MKKYLLTLGLLIGSGALIYLSIPSPTFAARAAAEETYLTFKDNLRQDTTPRTDTSKHKMKKHKMKKDSTWRKDSIPQ